MKELEDAFSLYFDGAFKQKEGQAAIIMVVFNPLGEVLMKRGMVLQDISSNNEAEYAALTMGLEWCVSNSINWLNMYGDSMLIVKQVQGTWSCNSDKLLARLREVRALEKLKIPKLTMWEGEKINLLMC